MDGKKGSGRGGLRAVLIALVGLVSISLLTYGQRVRTPTTGFNQRIFPSRQAEGLQLVGRVPGDFFAALAVRSPYVFVTEKGILVAVYDISRPDDARKVAYLLSDPNLIGGQVLLSSNYAYILSFAEGRSGGTFSVVDISDPARPRLVYSLPLSFSPDALVVKGNIAYLGTGRTLQVMDLSDPTTPRVVREVALTGELEGDGGTVVGNRLYLTEGTAGLSVWDITQPDNPTRIGILGNIGVARSVGVSGGYAFVSCGRWGSVRGALRVVNVSDPSALTVVAELPIGGNPWFPLIVTATTVYVGDFDTSRLFVVDVSSPTAPVEVARLRDRLPLAFDPSSRTLLAGRLLGFHTYDTTNPTSLRLLGSYPGIGPGAVTVNEGFAYCAEEDGLAVYDVRNPAAPRRASLWPLSTGATGNKRVVVSESLVAVSYLFSRPGNGNVFLFDASSPPLVTLRGSYSPDGFNTYGIALAGNFLFVAHSGGYDVVDISGGSPIRVFRGSLSGGAFATDVTVQDRLALLTSSDRRLIVLDISNPARPSERASLTLPFVPSDVEVFSNLAAVGGEGDLAVVDVGNPSAPRQVAMWDNSVNPGGATRVRFWGTTVVLSYYYGLRVFDLGRLPDLVSIASVDGASLEAAPFGDHLAVASGYGHLYGLNIYRRPTVGAFVVLDVNPRQAPAAAGVEVTVLGEGFQSGATFRLVRNGTVLEPTNVTFVSTQRLMGTVNLLGQPEGSVWDVIVRNPDGSEARKNQILTVLTTPVISTLTPATVFPRREQVTIAGNYFLEGVIVSFQPPSGSGLSPINALSVTRETSRRVQATFDFSSVASFFNSHPSENSLTGPLVVRNPNGQEASANLSVVRPLLLAAVEPSEVALIPGEPAPAVTLRGSFLAGEPLSVRLIRGDSAIDGTVLSLSETEAQVTFPGTLPELDGHWNVEATQLSVKAQGNLRFREFMRILSPVPIRLVLDQPGTGTLGLTVTDVGPGLSAKLRKDGREISATQVEVRDWFAGYAVTATFRFGREDLGTWDLVLTRQDGRSRTYQRAVVIAPNFVISEISTDTRFSQFDLMTVTVKGRWLINGTRVLLVPPQWARVSESVIEPVRITYSEDATEIKATFSIFDKIAPEWFGGVLENFRIPVEVRVVADETAGGVVRGTTVPIETPALIVNFAGPSRIRLGAEETYTLTINNHCNLPDTPFVILGFELDPAEGVRIRYRMVDGNGRVEAEGDWKPGDDEPGFSLNPHGGWVLGVPGYWNWRSHSLRVQVVPSGEQTGPRQLTVRVKATLISSNFLRAFVARQAREMGLPRARIFKTVLVHGIMTEMTRIDAEMGIDSPFPDDFDFRREAERLADDYLSQYNLMNDLLKEATDLALSQAGSAAFKNLLLKKYPNLDEQLAEEGAGILMDTVKGSQPPEILLGWLVSKAGQTTGLGLGLDILTRLMKVAMTHTGKYVKASAYARKVLAQTVQDHTARPAPVVQSWDPNAKEGPTGVSGFLSGNQGIIYRIFFENLASASAAAQEVFLKDTLDPNLESDTLAFVQFGFGSHIVALPENSRQIGQDLRVRDDLVVQVRGSYDPATREVRVRFVGIDPATGRYHPDGFLPPNRNSPEGEGFVVFQIRPRADAPSGSVIRNRAIITFDPHLTGSQPLETNEHTLTLDNAKPVVQVTAPVSAPHPFFSIGWQGDDRESGLEEVQLWVSDDGSPYRLWKVIRPEGRRQINGSEIFQGRFGHRYRFYAIATDRVGNGTGVPDQPQASVRAGSPPRLPSGLRLITIPVRSEQPDPVRVVPFEENRWAWYDPVTGQYLRYPDPAAAQLTVGKGFWTRLREPVTPSVKGEVPDPSRPFSISVTRGWNLIGNPWLSSLTWDISAITFRGNEGNKALKDLSPGEGVEPYAWRWDGDAYQFVYDRSALPGADGQLSPWEGCWVYAHQNGELIFPPAGERRVSAPSRSPEGAVGWSATLQAQAGGHKSRALVGIVDTNRLRVALPPDPPEGSTAPIQLTIVGKEGHHYRADIRSGSAQKQQWDLIVSWSPSLTRGRQGPREVIVTWDGIGYAPRDWTLTLIDERTKTRRYLRTQTEYRFVPEEGEGERRFVLIAERGSQRPLKILGLRAMSGRGGGALIEFTLTKPAAVTAEVLTLTGRRVLPLPAGDGLVEGTRRIVWHSGGDGNRRLGPGFYLIRIVATDEEGRVVQGITTLRLGGR